MAELDDILDGASTPTQRKKTVKRPRSTSFKQDQITALVGPSDPTKSVRRKSKGPSIGTIYQSFKNFEETAGGRATLINTLAYCPSESPAALAARKLLADPELMGPKDLFTFAYKHKIAFDQLVTAFRDAKLAQIAMDGLMQLAPQAAVVVEQLAQDSQNRFDACPVCEGRTRVPRIGDNGEWVLDPDGAKVTQLCYNCRGTGKLFVKHDVQNRKMFLEVSGVLDKNRQPLIQQNFNQHAIIAGDFLPGDGSFEDLIKSIDVTPEATASDAIDVPYSHYDADLTPESTA